MSVCFSEPRRGSPLQQPIVVEWKNNWHSSRHALVPFPDRLNGRAMVCPSATLQTQVRIPLSTTPPPPPPTHTHTHPKKVVRKYGEGGKICWGINLSRKIMILQGVRHPISCLGVCYMNNPKNAMCMLSGPTLDLTTSLPSGVIGGKNPHHPLSYFHGLNIFVEPIRGSPWSPWSHVVAEMI